MNPKKILIFGLLIFVGFFINNANACYEHLLASHCKKTQNMNRKFRVGIFILLLLFLSEAGSFCIPDGFVPFVDCSAEIGKSYVFYHIPGVGSKWSYEGITISSGIKYYHTKFPVTFQITLLKGATEMRDYDRAYPIYGCGSLGIIPYKKLQWCLEIGTTYLRSFWAAEPHSAFSSYFNLVHKRNRIDLGTLIGVYWEDFSSWKGSESEFFIAGEIAFSKWFICPYLNLALINRLSYDSEWLVREPKKLTGFISLGFRIEPTRKGYISTLINKMTAPKKVGSR